MVSCAGQPPGMRSCLLRSPAPPCRKVVSTWCKSARTAESDATSPPTWWEEAWWGLQEAATWCFAVLYWQLRAAGRANGGMRYKTAQRDDLQTFNTYYSLLNYAQMATDVPRTRAFKQAIREALRSYRGMSKPYVLEIGCGPYAPLCQMCLDEGAEKVVAVEGNSWAASRASVRLRGYPAKVLAGLSQELSASSLGPELPQIVVMETVGDWAASEWMIGTFIDARGRLCSESARWIPGQVRTWFAPIATPEDWRIPGGILPPGLWTLGSDAAVKDRLLADPQILEFYDLNAFSDSMLKQEHNTEFCIIRSSQFQGFLIWVEVLPGGPAGPSVNALSTLDLSWVPILISLPKSRVVKSGESLRCRTVVMPATSDGPKMCIELLGEDTNAELRFEWNVASGARWIMPDGKVTSFRNQPDAVLDLNQQLAWQFLGPPNQ